MIGNRFRLTMVAAIGLILVTAVQAAADSTTADAATAATAQAIATLAKARSIDAGSIHVVRTESANWNDSSMGCGRAGTAALQVITEGYRVILSAGGREYPVHVAGDHAVICTRVARADDVRRALRVSGIEKAMQLAREDLAGRLNVDPATIRISNVRPVNWHDSALECPRPNESVTSGSHSGFTMDLKLKGRAFAYRADATQARACPAIESE